MSNWGWQGFYGPMNIALARKAEAETLPVSVVGVIIPPTGGGVVTVDLVGETGMFAVQTREDAQIAVPNGLFAARPEIVGRLVGA